MENDDPRNDTLYDELPPKEVSSIMYEATLLYVKRIIGIV